MLDLRSLHALSARPTIDQISLKLLLNLYEQYLMPYRYSFELDNGMSILLDFEEKSLCHLLGIESVVKRSVNSRDLLKYKGKLGFDNIKSGTIDFKELKRLGGKGKFNDSKDKMIHFYLLPRILEAPNVMIVDYQMVTGSQIDVELLLFEIHHNSYIHLGITKDQEIGVYFPQTFFVERVTPSSTGARFIDGQKIASVSKTSKVAKILEPQKEPDE